MAGDNTTLVLTESLDVISLSARSRRENAAVVPQLVDTQTLNPNTGTSWRELLYEQISAQSIDETTVNENFQQFDDSQIVITPQMVQIVTFITDKAKRNLNSLALGQMGALAGNAMMRQKDEEGITALEGSTLDLGTANTPAATTDVSHASFRIDSNTTEVGGVTGINAVFHGFVIADFYDELVTAVGTAAIPLGATADVFKRGWFLPIADVGIFKASNITIDGSDDAIGTVFAREAWILVSGMSIKTEVERLPRRGGGGDAVVMTDEHAYGERSQGNWSFNVTADATAPA